VFVVMFGNVCLLVDLWDSTSPLVPQGPQVPIPSQWHLTLNARSLQELLCINQDAGGCTSLRNVTAVHHEKVHKSRWKRTMWYNG